MKRKTFTEGDAVEFRRDTAFMRAWETGTYVAPDGWDDRGWHRVKSDTGERLVVPTRHLRFPEGR